MTPFAAALLVFAFMALSHVMPWKLMPWLVDERNELKRIPAYTVGTSIILAGVLAWCMGTGDYEPFAVVAILDVAGAVGTIAPRIVKWVEESAKNRERLRVYEKADDIARQADEQRERTA